jgi:hypothetical protein
MRFSPSDKIRAKRLTSPCRLGRLQAGVAASQQRGRQSGDAVRHGTERIAEQSLDHRLADVPRRHLHFERFVAEFNALASG